MADELISRMRVPDGTSNVYVLKDEVARSRTEYETTTKTGNPIVLESGGQSVDDLKVQLEPTQDLHGYDNPWVGGAGKNILPNEITSYTESGVAFTTLEDGRIKINGTSAYNIYIHDICENFSLPEGSYILSYDAIEYMNVQICNRAENKEYLIATKDYPSRTLVVTSEMTNDMRVRFVASSGHTYNNVVTGVMIRLSSVTDATFEPYSNICPISGYDSVSVQRTGKNLYNKTQYPFTQYSVYNPSVCLTSPIFIKHGTYTFSCSSGFGNCYISVYKTFEDATAKINMLAQYNFGNGSSVTKTFDEDVYVRYQQNDTGGTDEDYAKVSQSWQTELGSEATDYEPYSGQEITIQLDDTVYGGTLNVSTGVLTVNWISKTFNGTFDDVFSSGSYVNPAESDPSTDSSFCLRVASQYIHKTGIALNVINNTGFTSNFKNETFNNINNRNSIGFSVQGNWAEAFMFYYPGLKTKQNWLDWFSNNPSQICWELATPQTIQLTPAQLTLLKGYNYISTNGTALELTCRDGLFQLAGDGANVVSLTRAEYDALPEAEKLNGTMYLITDQDGGFDIDNEVLQGSSHAVSGGAVYDALSVKEVTGYVINTALLNEPYWFKVYRTGNVVMIKLEAGSGTNSSLGMNQIASGLPKSITPIADGATFIDFPTNYGRSWVDGDGNMFIYCDPAYNGNMFINIVYITADV